MPPQTKSKSARAAAGDLTDADVVAAVDAVLAERGYDGLTVQAVAARAGVRAADLRARFRSPHDLFDLALAAYYDRHRTALAAALAADAPLRDRVHQLVDAWLDTVDANPTYARIVQAQLATDGRHAERIREHLRRALAPIETLLAEVTPADGPLAARHFHVSLAGVIASYFTYTPIIGTRAWGNNPLSPGALAERRAHVHWIVDVWLDALTRR